MTNGNLKARITASTLKSIKARKAEWFIKDTQIQGFQIKVLPSGKATYQVEARLGGKGRVKKFKIGDVSTLGVEEARERAKQALNDIRNGNDPHAKKHKELYEGMTLEMLLEDYINRPHKKLKERTIKDYTNYVDYHFGGWKAKRVKDITKYEIKDWYDSGSKTPTYTHSAFRALKALMNYAIAIDVIETNPCDFVTKRGVYSQKKRSTHLEPQEDLGKFLKAFTEFDFQKDSQKCARDLIILMLTTGLRFSEARKIKFEDVDLEKKLVTIRNTKNHKDHIVPLVALTFTLFRKRFELNETENEDYVFRIRGNKTKSKYVTDIRKTLNAICDKAGVKRVTPHDLRRTFASTLNNVGVGFVDVKALMNHSDRDVTLMYIQNNFEKLRNYLMAAVAYYDKKIKVPENIKAGWSEQGTDMIQSAIYGNVQPEFDPINPQDFDLEQKASLERDYWYGTDA